MNTKTNRKRGQGAPGPEGKQEAIADALLAQIMEGRLKPGSQLPTYVELERQYGVSRTTLQQVMGRLKRDGFIQSEERKGLFVASRPSHLARYALIYPEHEGDNRFWTILAREAASLVSDRQGELVVFRDIRTNSPNGADVVRLQQETKARRLAGLIFVTPQDDLPSIFSGSPVFEDPALPRIAIGTDPIPGTLPLNLDNGSWVERALERLVARRCKRIAWLAAGDLMENKYLLPALAKRRLNVPPAWRIPLGLSCPQGANPVIQLLMSLPSSVRPNGLMIADDHLVEHVASGLVAAGVRVPDDMEVIAHTNWPWPAPAILPFMRLGFDTREVVTRCLDAIDARRQRQSAPNRICVQARFEEEVDNPLK